MPEQYASVGRRLQRMILNSANFIPTLRHEAPLGKRPSSNRASRSDVVSSLSGTTSDGLRDTLERGLRMDKRLLGDRLQSSPSIARRQSVWCNVSSIQAEAFHANTDSIRHVASFPWIHPREFRGLNSCILLISRCLFAPGAVV